MIAMDSEGNLYSSVLQSNSNSFTMRLFLKHLINKLDDEDKHWRKKRIIMWDGAGYHTSKEMLKFIQDYEIPVMRLGPYSYLM
jgi:transposase